MTRLRVVRGIAKTGTRASIDVFETLKRRDTPTRRQLQYRTARAVLMTR